MKLKNIQFLRGISALLVCCFHFKNSLNFNDFNWGDLLFNKGSIGVPIFFVISGFIMVYTSKNINLNHSKIHLIVDFLIKRVIRIVPLYYLLTFAWIFLGGSLLAYFQGDLVNRLWHSLLFLPQKEFPILYLGWSLNYEMFFYFIFALSFFFTTKRYYFIILFFTAAIVLGQIFKPRTSFFKIISDPINLYFVNGIVLGLLLKYIEFSKKTSLAFLTLSTISFVLLLLNFIPENLTWMHYPIVTSFVLSFLILDQNFKSSPHPFLVYLGDISYSIYLSHPFVEILFRHINLGENGNILEFVLQIGVVILTSSLLYLIIEKKMTNFLKEKIC